MEREKNRGVFLEIKRCLVRYMALVYMLGVADTYVPKAANHRTIGKDAGRLPEGPLDEPGAPEEKRILDHGFAVELAGYELQARHLEWREGLGQYVEPRRWLDLAAVPVKHH